MFVCGVVCMTSKFPSPDTCYIFSSSWSMFLTRLEIAESTQDPGGVNKFIESEVGGFPQLFASREISITHQLQARGEGEGATRSVMVMWWFASQVNPPFLSFPGHLLCLLCLLKYVSNEIISKCLEKRGPLSSSW